MEEKKKLVLVADDFKDTREMYHQFLSLHGLAVALANDGSGALAQALQLQPDLILMDLSLPDISGTEVVRRLKADQRTEHIPIFALTAYGPERMAAAFMEAGFSGYLTKTASLDEVLNAVVRELGIANPKIAPENPAAVPARPEGWNGGPQNPSHTGAEEATGAERAAPLILLADD
jgi:CheY-like chemotaxis protein